MAARVVLAVLNLNKIASGRVLGCCHNKVPVCTSYYNNLQHWRQFGDDSPSSSDSDVVLPKRPSTSFNRFYMEKLIEIREKHPDVKTVTGLSKIAGGMWKSLSEEDKKVYKDAYLKEKEEFDAKMTPKVKQLMKEKALEKKVEKSKKKTKKESKSLGRPRPPPSGYSLFVKEKSSDVTHSLSAQQELMKDLAQLWKAMVEAEKKPYRDRAAIERAQYQKDLKDWEKKMYKSGRLEFIRKATINELTMPKVTKPKKRD
ncbi:transcription factor A, mitochondrial-like [Lineus longissimus]|uniref:transcription factor A, mitochondrial-like n=1 Tax=Lineus longissimus TaxID=88925 RepID=UPI002B4E5D81